MLKLPDNRLTSSILSSEAVKHSLPDMSSFFSFHACHFSEGKILNINICQVRGNCLSFITIFRHPCAVTYVHKGHSLQNIFKPLDIQGFVVNAAFYTGILLAHHALFLGDGLLK